MLELSNHLASLARGCWMKFKWYYVDGLEPLKAKPVVVSLGAIIHSAFDLHYRGMNNETIVRHINDEFEKEISKVEMPDQEELIVAKWTALGMWNAFPFKDLKEYEEIYSEEKFSVPLGDLLNVILKGKIDRRVKKNNIWWVKELKTTGLSQRQFEGRIRTSDQATTYVYGTRSYGVQGVMYDCIKRPYLRKRVNETANDYGLRILHDYHDRKEYYFSQHYTYRNEIDLKHFEEDAIKLAEEMLDKLEKKNFYRNTDQCWNFNAECPYLKICFQEMPDPLTLELYYKKR
jgi:hypothetical protein